MAQLQNISDTCGFTDYLDFVTYPPAGQLPFPAGVINGTTSLERSCGIWDMIIDAVQLCVYIDLFCDAYVLIFFFGWKD